MTTASPSPTAAPLNLPTILIQKPNPRVPILLRILEYLTLSALIIQGLGIFVLYKLELLELVDAGFLDLLSLSSITTIGLFLFLFLVNQQIKVRVSQKRADLTLQYRATLWAVNIPEPQRTIIVSARQKALTYAQELIEDYKKTRSVSRNLYYSLQIATILLSGLTPILVLLDKIQTSDSWLRWLPIAFPAIASIVASIVTSFPFQETWISANTTVELLEAEQEKFVLGVTAAYAPPLTTPEINLQAKANQAIDSFISNINGIHLKRVQETGGSQKSPDVQDSGEKPENAA